MMSTPAMLYKVIGAARLRTWIRLKKKTGLVSLAKGKNTTISEELIAFRCPRKLALETRWAASERRVGISEYIRARLAEAAEREQSDAKPEER